MTPEIKTLKNFKRFEFNERPYEGTLKEFKKLIAEMKTGETIEGIENLKIFIFGRPTDFSGGWEGTANIISVKKTETHYFIHTQSGALYCLRIEDEGAKDYIGVVGSGGPATVPRKQVVL